MEQTGSLKDFEMMKKLGEGAFGQVYMVKRKRDGQTYAMKKVKLISLKDKEKQNALNQIRILASLNHQFIVKFKEAFFDSSSNCLCIIMEYASGGDVYKMINTHLKSRVRIKESEIWKALLHITKGLKSLHDKKILHRDLKAANVFVSEDGKYKLGDLNVSKVLKKGLAHTQTGTPYYASPQVWQDLPYDMKSDMWSLGCVIYEMAALQPPFKASDLQSLYKKVKAGKYRQLPSCYSQQLNQVISLLLKLNPKDRLDAETLLKNSILVQKCGLDEKENDFQLLLGNTDPLLKTIKYNPYNLNSIKDKLPKSSYDEEKTEAETLRGRDRSRDSLESLNFQSKDRVLSACKVRNEDINNPSYHYKGLTPMIPDKYSINAQRQAIGLPPRQRKLTEDNERREPNYHRLRRIGEDIISNGSNKYIN